MPEPPLSHATRTAADPPVRSNKPDAERLVELRNTFARGSGGFSADHIRELFGIAERATRNRAAISEAMGQIGPAFVEVRRGLGKIDELLKLHERR